MPRASMVPIVPQKGCKSDDFSIAYMPPEAMGAPHPLSTHRPNKSDRNHAYFRKQTTGKKNGYCCTYDVRAVWRDVSSALWSGAFDTVVRMEKTERKQHTRARECRRNARNQKTMEDPSARVASTRLQKWQIRTDK
ncbi:hypothetical protein Bbelb_387440 [Branchiostoma belcheri]|nr:hypothetical protein Bbelb_387440 [Branchiostoma belcheri]